MDALARFERLVEGIVEAPFTAMRRGSLQPMDMARGLARAMDDGLTVGSGRSFVPNEYVVHLSPADFAIFHKAITALSRELTGFLAEAARDQRYSLLGPISVRLEEAEDVRQGKVRVSTSFAEQEIPPASPGDAVTSTLRNDKGPSPSPPSSPSEGPLLLLHRPSGQSKKYLLDKPIVRIGRALDNDIVIEDITVSRYHAEMRRNGDLFTLRDLSSHNGTLVNGRKIQTVELRDGDLLLLGDSEMRFRRGDGVTGDAAE